MGKYYIYNSKVQSKKYNQITVVFNPDIKFNFNSLKQELTKHYSTSSQTDALLFITSSDNTNVEKEIKDNIQLIFKSIPKVQEDSLIDNLLYIQYDGNNLLTKTNTFLHKNKKEIINKGLANIFIKNGGLVETNGMAHHYVFPSGKHSSKFLRTANVLVKKAEIDFIAINTLHLFKGQTFNNIYCDTLSINVIGYSMINYIKRFNGSTDINVESFKSYDGLYNKESVFYDNSIFLISASTSGGLIEYIKTNHPEVHSNEICVLFYLPIEKKSEVINERTVCNLEYNNDFDYGLDLYDIYKPPTKKCLYCDNNSASIKILGDSFSIDEPIINTKNITVKNYVTQKLKDFTELFKYQKDIGTSLKVSFSENTITRKKYSVYIDYENIISNITSFPKHKEKLDSYIQQYVPASLKYIVHLNDNGSKMLSEYILSGIKDYVNSEKVTIINQSELSDSNINEDETGSILIVGSCISNGKNLLYLSRYFRNFEKIRLIYFVGINRTSDNKKNKELKTNIKYGLYGPENSTYIEVENIDCDNSNIETPWEVELNFLKEIQQNQDVPTEFINKRISIINQFESIENRGGSDRIFFSNYQNKELEIRKNSAFFNDNKYFENISQSDVYFSISCVLNNMRNNQKDGLFQTTFVKNLIDPFIFNRFNDGIIQASILRASKSNELNYSLSFNQSKNMLSLIKTFIKYKEEQQGEAIFEFLYSIAIGKLRLHNDHYLVLLKELDELDEIRMNIFKQEIKIVYKKNCL
ncbi:hypothetical protein [Lacinutrix undariae]